ncbi:MAG: hypothetical protein M3Z97_01450 [Candidatus Dormibacteraeota bacterium]|nr:hypothetical protein [Candidatus Dormibacteraeota bacterium]
MEALEPNDRYARLLRDSDLRLLAAAAAGGVGVERLRRSPELVEALLERKEVFDSLFGSPERDPLLVASPFLVFSVVVGRVASELERSSYVEEWLAPGRSLPVFDVGSLREFLAARQHRVFLAAVLTSFTRVTSGTTWQRTARGWRRRRYSDLDPLRLAQLLEAVLPGQRPAVTRRLGDLALFLSGVFPEHAARHPLQPREVDALQRLLGGPGPGEVIRSSAPEKGIWLLEWLGRRAYNVTAEWAPENSDLVEVAEAFGRARRVLNLVTSRYLYPSRDRWFPANEA